MEKFDKKAFDTSRGFTYTYYVSQPSKDAATESLPTLVFHHGWPDHAEMWSGIIKSLVSKGIPNRILVPDMLGYDGTSKPTDPTAYKSDGMAQDMVEILASESINSVISIGHDWGCLAATRLYNFHPELVTAMILLNVHYRPPTRQRFDLDQVNNMMIQAVGYPVLAYWKLFAAPEGPKILRENVSRLYSAMHAVGYTSMRDFFCKYDAIKSYLLSDSPEVEVRPYAKDPEMKAAFVKRMTRDGFDAPQQWYVVTKDNHQYEAERHLPADRDKVNVPVLYVGADQDYVATREGGKMARDMGLLPDLEEHMVEATHWSPYEKPEEVAENMASWLSRRGFAGKA